MSKPPKNGPWRTPLQPAAAAARQVFRVPLNRPTPTAADVARFGFNERFTVQDLNLIGDIVARAQYIAGTLPGGAERFHPEQYVMILCMCHKHACPLNLMQLAMSDHSDFCHDVFGIAKHWDAATDRFLVPFKPIFAKDAA